ncbi:MAG: relaxase/mobilization nuclease domain-containing protein [Gammaproteobacteria bacterium]|nr:relaxase/mobilization nuclease domain-containing protein [Gammaproteobacteria bacterium]
MANELFEDRLCGQINRTGKLRPLRVSEAYHNAKGYGQAILKVSSYAKSLKGVRDHLQYIARENELPLEDPQGNVLSDRGEIEDVLDHWFADADRRKNARMTVNIILSAPAGSDREAVQAAVRDFARSQFSENHDYLFAMHNDTDHPHAHLSVKLRGYDGQKLRLGKQELFDLRSRFAESLRERGIQAVATSRASRAVGTKGDNLAITKMKKAIAKGEMHERLWTIESAAKEAIETAEESVHDPWEKAMLTRHAQVLSEYGLMVETLRTSKNTEHHTMAETIEGYAKALTPPQTRRQQFVQQYRAQQAAVSTAVSPTTDQTRDDHER